MTDKQDRGSYASRDEVEAAVLSLSPTELIRLKRIAQLRVLATHSMGWEDLLQEGISRALAGSRKWPTLVPFVAFLAQTMRSIANEELAGQARRAEVPNAELVGEDDSSMDTLAVDHATPERTLLNRELLNYVNEIFANVSRSPDAAP